MMFGNGILGLLVMGVVFLLSIGGVIGLVWLAVWAFRRTGIGDVQATAPDSHGQTTREIAATRYAKGELSREEYQQILSDLGN